MILEALLPLRRTVCLNEDLVLFCSPLAAVTIFGITLTGLRTIVITITKTIDRCNKKTVGISRRLGIFQKGHARESCVRNTQTATALGGQRSIKQVSWGNKFMFRYKGLLLEDRRRRAVTVLRLSAKKSTTRNGGLLWVRGPWPCKSLTDR